MLKITRVGWLVPVALAFAMTGAGCQPNKPKTAATTDPAALESLRKQVAERNPNSNVGVVSETLPDGKFVAVADMPVELFKAGDVITFVNGDTTPIANGTVRAISGTTLHVEVDQTVTGGRAVMKGDLAVRFKP